MQNPDPDFQGREITSHIVEGNNPHSQLNVTVADPPGEGGASHIYLVSGITAQRRHPAFPEGANRKAQGSSLIVFQQGPIKEAGLNGLTQEVLLAIVKDRLEGFQAGPFPCPENKEALIYVEGALEALKARTRKRLARGVEGRMEV